MNKVYLFPKNISYKYYFRKWNVIENWDSTKE